MSEWVEVGRRRRSEGMWVGEWVERVEEVRRTPWVSGEGEMLARMWLRLLENER